ncbi:MAG TPA: ABC transporter ATP-binding protein [Tahibacter sp.]|uniref:ABC transporter ATP-binding protein n=1 Tax=Tahibacter sp. TaxID=2056211 RepID=UPI002D10E549|nr:ABC transporter ATP-binding protein [Tahibacter sp.]HSX59809.1 ABC transporter ATP-binding protein [Tahibacter sp.]
MSALRLDGVSKRYGGRIAVDALSLVLAPGEIYALLGPNGAGKTTTVNLILGFAAADAGTIEVGGTRVDRAPLAARAKLAYLPETVMLHPALDAIENLRYFALLGGRRLGTHEARTLLTEAGLQQEAQVRRTEAYSKGMRQKVGLAIALARRAGLLLLDEPTSGLDASAANDLTRCLRTAAARGIAVLMATHDLYRVRELADRLGVLREGRLVLEQSTGSLGPAQIEALYLAELAA